MRSSRADSWLQSREGAERLAVFEEVLGDAFVASEGLWLVAEDELAFVSVKLDAGSSVATPDEGVDNLAVDAPFPGLHATAATDTPAVTITAITANGSHQRRLRPLSGSDEPGRRRHGDSVVS